MTIHSGTARRSQVRILVFGAGVIGSVYAVKLLQAGHEVVMLARGRRLEDLQTNGLVLEEATSGNRTVLAVQSVGEPAPADRYEVVLVPVRSEQLASTLPVLTAMHDGSDVLFFGNTAGHQAELLACLGERALFGFPAAGGVRDGSVIKYVLIRQQKTMLGEPTGAMTPRGQHLQDELTGAGFPATISTSIDDWLLGHAAFIAPIAFALYRVDTDPAKLAADPRTLLALAASLTAVLARLIARRLHVPGDPVAALDRNPRMHALTRLPTARAATGLRQSRPCGRADRGGGFAAPGGGAGGTAGRPGPAAGLVVAGYRPAAGSDQAGGPLQTRPAGTRRGAEVIWWRVTRHLRAVIGDDGTGAVWPRLTPEGWEVFRLAHDEARRLGHPCVADEHVIIGLLRHGRSQAAALLEARGLDLAAARSGLQRHGPALRPGASPAAALLALGIDAATIRQRLEDSFGTAALEAAERRVRRRPRWRGGHPRPDPLCVHLLAKRALQMAAQFAARQGDPGIGPEHLLYGVLQDALDPLGTQLSRRSRRQMVPLGFTPGQPNPVRLQLQARGIDLQQLAADVRAAS
jgi:ketopantoate reductase